VTPFLVFAGWLVNRRLGAPAGVDEPRVGSVARWVIGSFGVLALVQGVVMFVAPTQVIAIWPWMLTPLTCRVVGAIFCLGASGIGVFVDPRWTTARLMLQVQVLMFVLMLLAAFRARTEFFVGRPLTWLMLGGFVGLLIGSAYLWQRMEVGERRVIPRLGRTRVPE
jgi:hypothetical protein